MLFLRSQNFGVLKLGFLPTRGWLLGWLGGYLFTLPTHTHFFIPFFPFSNPVTFQNVSSFGKITEWQIYNVFFCTFAAV